MHVSNLTRHKAVTGVESHRLRPGGGSSSPAGDLDVLTAPVVASAREGVSRRSWGLCGAWLMQSTSPLVGVVRPPVREGKLLFFSYLAMRVLVCRPAALRSTASVARMNAFRWKAAFYALLHVANAPIHGCYNPF